MRPMGVIGPVVSQFADRGQLLRRATGEHQDIGMTPGSFQSVGQQARIVLIDQDDDLTGDAVLDVTQEFTYRIHFRLVILQTINRKGKRQFN